MPLILSFSQWAALPQHGCCQWGEKVTDSHPDTQWYGNLNMKVLMFPNPIKCSAAAALAARRLQKPVVAGMTVAT
jgi:hypothetical protein